MNKKYLAEVTLTLMIEVEANSETWAKSNAIAVAEDLMLDSGTSYVSLEFIRIDSVQIEKED